ncbi:MAG: hypothetical protein EXS08_14115 [Planctomycetes bacterium]|nr:hypothetical protein [Planctomycetota bacterium]
MKIAYDSSSADALAPLLESIGRELSERRTRLDALDLRIGALRESPFFSAELAALESAAAAERRELRHCHEELERLGLSVVGTMPLTIRIPTRGPGSTKNRVWRQGQESNN